MAKETRVEANLRSSKNPFRQGISPFENGHVAQAVVQFKTRPAKRKPLKPEPVRLELVHKMQLELSAMVGGVVLEAATSEGLRTSPRSGRVLPRHWTAHFDGELNRAFYRNELDGTSHWSLPENAVFESDESGSSLMSLGGDHSQRSSSRWQQQQQQETSDHATMKEGARYLPTAVLNGGEGSGGDVFDDGDDDDDDSLGDYEEETQKSAASSVSAAAAAAAATSSAAAAVDTIAELQNADNITGGTAVDVYGGGGNDDDGDYSMQSESEFLEMQQAATTTFLSPGNNTSNNAPSRRDRDDSELPSARERSKRRQAIPGGSKEEEDDGASVTDNRQYASQKRQRLRPGTGETMLPSMSNKTTAFAKLSEKRNVLFIEDGCLDSLDTNLDYALTLPKTYEPEYPSSGPPPGEPLNYTNRQSLMDVEIMEDIPRTFNGGHRR